MAKYDFDTVIDRINTASAKWDSVEKLFGAKDILPMWVADMDFKSPPSVVEAMKKRAEHGIYGYTFQPDSYYEAVIDWMRRRHHWEVEWDWICHGPGVVSSLSVIVSGFTQPGDWVVIQPPVYYPFMHVIMGNDRQMLFNPLKFQDGRYTMDFEDLDKKLAENDVKLLILCHPHNPVGRVWTKDELTELGNICLEHHTIVASDEIHFDLVYRDYTHTSFATISEEFAQNSIICTAASKTFNLAGLNTSNIIIPNQELRETYNKALAKAHLNLCINIFGVVAMESAYRYGEEWLNELMDYVQKNLDLLNDFCKKHDGIEVIQPEGTYLVWLDCRGLGLDAKSLENFWRKKAKVGFDDGPMFGPGGEGFARMNIACPRALMEDALNRIDRALGNLK